MDEQYLLATARYVELNPVKAKLCAKPEDWRWSSARAHMLGKDDHVVAVHPMLERVSDWKAYLAMAPRNVVVDSIRRFSSSGRPVGSNAFIQSLEILTGKQRFKKKPGPKPGIK